MSSIQLYFDINIKLISLKYKCYTNKYDKNKSRITIINLKNTLTNNNFKLKYFKSHHPYP